MADAVIIGAGGHARVIASLLTVTPRFVTTTPDTEAAALAELVASLPGADYYLGVGSNADRLRIAARLRAHGARLPPCVAPNAFVARDAELGDGVVLCPGAVVGARARLAPACIVNTLSSVDHDCVLGEGTQVTVGVTFGGTITVGRNGFFGMKTAIVPNRTIGDDVVVMAGALVTRDVPDRVMVGGVPARIVRQL